MTDTNNYWTNYLELQVLVSGLTTISADTLADSNRVRNRIPLDECLIIPEGITTIEDCAFSYSSNLKRIVLPSTLIEIKSHAFYYSDIEEIVFSPGLAYIGVLAFSHCYNLKEVILPDTVETLEPSVFSGCKNLTKVSIGDGLKRIPFTTFENCPQLKTIKLGKSLSEIGNRAFESCTSLKKVIIPENVTKIENSAFLQCSKLRCVVFLSEPKLYDDTFRGCTNLRSITAPENIKNYLIQKYKIPTDRRIFSENSCAEVLEDLL